MGRILFVLPQESSGQCPEAAGAMAWLPWLGYRGLAIVAWLSWLGCQDEAAVTAIVVACRNA
jgi:hypothetical protein